MKKFDSTGKKLTDINKESPFRVPEGYFNSFPAKLTETIRSQNNQPISKRYLSNWKLYAAAAILIVVAILTGILSNRNSQQRADLRFYSEVSELVENELYSINEQTIIEVTSMKESSPDTAMITDEVIHYLLNEDIENELMDAL